MILLSIAGKGPTVCHLSENEVAKKKYLPKIAKETKLTTFATSELTMGSDLVSLRCNAMQDGNDYILNDTKYWITNGGVADFISAFAPVDPNSQHAGIWAFLVETGWEGVTILSPPSSYLLKRSWL